MQDCKRQLKEVQDQVRSLEVMLKLHTESKRVPLILSTQPMRQPVPAKKDYSQYSMFVAKPRTQGGTPQYYYDGFGRRASRARECSRENYHPNTCIKARCSYEPETGRCFPGEEKNEISRFDFSTEETDTFCLRNKLFHRSQLLTCTVSDFQVVGLLNFLSDFTVEMNIRTHQNSEGGFHDTHRG